MRSPLGYHDRLKERARTSAEIEDEKRRMDQAPTIEDLTARLDAQEQQSLDVQDHLGFRDELVPIDDGTPPSAPQNVTATPFMRGLEVSWDDPPPEDVVEKARIVATPRGNPAALKAVEVSRLGGAVADLAGGVVHDLSVVFVDRWGHESAPAAATGTPQRTAAEEIDLDQLAMNERIRGMLPNANLAPIGDSSKFAEGVVQSVALAAGLNANVLPMEEAEFENYREGAWPPAGVPAARAAGTTASVVTRAGRKNLRFARPATAADGWIYPFASWGQRGMVGEGLYIFSCSARVVSGGNATVAPYGIRAADTAGTGAERIPILDSGYSVPSDGLFHRVFFRFRNSNAKPFVQFAVEDRTPGTTVDLREFQLEAVGPEKTEPGPYSVPAATFGAMSGYLLATMDLAAVNAVIGDAAIDSAKIKRLVVDRLDAGTFTAGNITLAGNGALRAGRTVLNALGITLPVEDGFTDPTSNTDMKLGAATGIAAMNFYQAIISGNNHRGASVKAIGNGAGIRGNIVLHSLYRAGDGPFDPTSGALEVRSSHSPQSARIYVSPMIELAGDMVMSGNLTVGGRLVPDFLGSFGSVPANSTGVWDHNLGVIPSIMAGHQNIGSGRYKPLPAGGDAFGVYIEWCSTTQVAIRNNESQAWSCRPILFK
jgi:hypothetical protein